MAAKYPPYVNGYGNIAKLFKTIKDASVPPKFTNNFMQTALGLQSYAPADLVVVSVIKLGVVLPIPAIAWRLLRKTRDG